MSRGDKKRFLILGIGLLLGVFLLLGGMHHHDGHEVCFTCITLAAVALPGSIIAIVLSPLTAQISLTVSQAPSWFLWLAHNRRGPPAPTR